MMSGSQDRSGFEKQFPGCIRSMINVLVVFSSGTARTKLLTQKSHSDVVSYHSDVSRKSISVATNKMGDMRVSSDQRRSPPSGKLGGTPIKAHIAQETRKEVKSNQKAPTVVARLMGLDSLPTQKSALIDKQTTKMGSSGHDLMQEVRSSGFEEGNHLDNQTSQTPEKKIRGGVLEVCQQVTCQSKDQSMQQGLYDYNSHRMRMDLVQQKFIEAKRLATNENFLQSKEFRDAIEVLSSNRDVFLMFLEEPNALISKHLYGLQSAPLPSQTKRITLLKPLSTNEEKCQKGKEEQLHQADGNARGTRHRRTSSFPEMGPRSLSQPTRIVVLKPSPVDPCDVKKAGTSTITSTGLFHGQGSRESLQTDDTLRSRELAKEITRRMRESLSKSRKNGDLLSSILSGGYVGDESSFHRTESDYMEEEVSSLNNPEIATPSSQHSWDFLKRAGGSRFIPSLDQAPHSSEACVVKEAKKRLSERFALVVASSVNGQEQRQESRSSNTLGEMLAIPALTNEEGIDASNSRLSSEENHPEAPLMSLSNDIMKDEYGGNNSPIKLSRFKSLPVSPSVYESSESNASIPSSMASKHAIQKGVCQSKTIKSSLKDKFASLFFSRNKKQNKEKLALGSSGNPDDRLQHETTDVQSSAKGDDFMEGANSICVDPNKPAKCDQTAASCTASVYDRSDMVFLQSMPYFEKSRACGNIIEDQMSPTPALESEFSDGLSNPLSKSSGNVFARHPQSLSRSPPIESVARSLSRSNCYLERTTSYPIRSSSVLSKADEEQAQFVFVEKLVSSAALSKDKSGLEFTSWYSLDVPLNPLLLDELVYMKDNEEDDDVKHHVKRSDKRLFFDCVNEALLDLSLNTMLASYPWTMSRISGVRGGSIAGVALAEEVWGVIRSWISRENCSVVQCSNNPNSVAENLVAEVIGGRQWSLSMRLEMHELSKEIGGKLLEDLVEEALSELIT